MLRWADRVFQEEFREAEGNVEMECLKRAESMERKLITAMRDETGGRKMTCDKCGKTIPENAVFCGYCGTRCEEKKVCRACGAELKKGSCFVMCVG